MVNTEQFVDIPVIDIAMEFVGAPPQLFTLRPLSGDTIQLSKDRERYVINVGARRVRIERRNVCWFEEFSRLDRIYLSGSPLEMQQQREALLRGSRPESLPSAQ